LSTLSDYTALKTSRYERKFPVEGSSLFQVESLIKTHPKLFSEIYKKRSINNIYFDTPAFDFYQDNQFGKADRKKVRIRWYGSRCGSIKSPILEIKIKNGLAGTKKSYRLPKITLDENGELPDFLSFFSNAGLPDEIMLLLNNVTPTLYNSYMRKYYLDYSKNYRLTLDSNMSYCDIRSRVINFDSGITHEGKMVLELKYDLNHDDKASYYTTYFPFRMDKHSKYVNGIEVFRAVTH